MDQQYEALLNVAIAAAREAGTLLRADLFAPSGPAGRDSHHADADEAAERVIRERLLAATPSWGYRGEETGYARGQEGRHIWLVDPNDGTASYLRGYRGSAVSIALLRDGVPVLGVVYAFAAPDNAGDLFAWAEDVGPLTRNGRPIRRAPWATQLSPHTALIVSQSADRASAANLRCVAPGRYLAVPSIAYRLALTAAGEGEVGVSLAGAVAWDYAAGHALLRGAGGALVDQDGQPVTYTTDGVSQTHFCFGGAPALVAEVARRPWSDTFAHVPKSSDPYTLCRPLPGHAVADDGVLERAQGCLLGQLAGDALGSMVEFKSAGEIVRRYPDGLREIADSPVWGTLAGQPTDDSELALVLARTLLRDGAFDDEAVAAAYGYWRESDPFDVGGTIGAATGAIRRVQDQQRSLAAAMRAAANRGSEANGALMRQSPLAIWGHALDEAALDAIVRADTTLTHPNRACQDASAAFIVALAAVIREGLDAEAAYARACLWDQQHGASSSVSKALADARQRPPGYEHNQGHVLIALQNAFYQALHASSLHEGVTATVMGGGDTDTNGAIAGALLGALYGAGAVPAQWKRAVLTCRPLHDAEGVLKPRPLAFWPVDALYLAERLLIAGRDSAAAASTLPRADIGTSAAIDAAADRSVDGEATGRPSAHEAASDGAGRSRGDGHTAPARARFIGALLGGAIGDALGRTVEGWEPAAIEQRFGRLSDYQKWRGWRSGPIGTVTDDTQMTMCVAECLVANGWLNPEDLARRFVAWLPIGRGKGHSTTAAVERLRDGVPWYAAGDLSSGNAPAMRSAPIGLLRWNDPARLRAEAVLSALPTHRQPMGVAGAVAMAAATAWLLRRPEGPWTPGDTSLFIAAVQESIVGMESEALAERRDPSVKTTLRERIGLVPSFLDDKPATVFARLYNGAYVLESLPAALYCFLRGPEDVEATLLLAVNAGYDADTVAALAGTLGGALSGVEALPARLLDDLEYCVELTELADRLYDLAMRA